MAVPGQVLGIEGTAWNLSAAVFGQHLIALSSHPYSPPQGGIHPREAAQHHAARMREVISAVMTDPSALDGIAFSIGPGLGPCLRTVATAARALSLSLDLPLAGVNHCVAHVEIGRYATGSADPIVLYVSGANTQVIGYLNGRYRIFGETLDIGLGNALDKFARGIGLPHPGGPAIEKLAAKGTRIDLPYTVKGMDLAFSGLVSAAAASHAPIEDVCHSFQEVAFAMCVEVTERALAHAGKNEVLLVGGVGVNRRLQEMLRTMCEDRGAELFVPDARFMGDNGAMIAYTGRLMIAAGDTLTPGESRVLPGFRADQVDLSFRPVPTGPPSFLHPHAGPGETAQGAEAIVTIGLSEVKKVRSPKRYREPLLDIRLITERTRAEARLIGAARRAGVPTPLVRDVSSDTLVMERIDGPLLREKLTAAAVHEAGLAVGRLHQAGIIHGDLTTSNIILRDGRAVLIDFGLAYVSGEKESRGVDLHVFLQTLRSTAPGAPGLEEAFLEGYRETFPGAPDVIARVGEITARGRYL